jgi:uncharacterized membrane protein YgdD (TMEM256/DUF423 family)
MSDISHSGNTWKTIRASLVIAGVQVFAGVLLALASSRGFISNETMLRGAMMVVGLGLAAVANMIPKRPDGPPPPTLQLAVLRQTVMRTAGWAMMVGGLLFAGLWAFAPLDVAPIGAAIALGVSMVLGLSGVTWWIFAYHRAPRR